MKHLIGLTKELQDSQLFKSAQFDSWAENILIYPLFDHQKEGYRAVEISYQAVFNIEKYSYKNDPSYLFVIVGLYLQENDNDTRQLKNLPPPSMEVDENGNGTADIEISIEFYETIYLTKDDQGKFEIYGKKYSLGQTEAQPFESLGYVGDVDLEPTP